MDTSETGRHEGSAPEQGTASSVGDLQFDEAWADAQPSDDDPRERAPRDDDPSFEDPNDR